VPNCMKVTYLKRAESLAALRAIARRQARRGLSEPKGVYLCSPCGGWHLTSRPGIQAPPWIRRRKGA
jgi:hypothetical protein